MRDSIAAMLYLILSTADLKGVITELESDFQA
jgi:hypothetical protein